MFDVVDVIFNFSGVITGYAVSPDSRYVHLTPLIIAKLQFWPLSRYLYVNFRPWASNVLIGDPYDPPPVALCVERVVCTHCTHCCTHCIVHTVHTVYR